ncbi:MAG: serine/threonine-protein kinase [Pseudomonadota bacterium]
MVAAKLFDPRAGRHYVDRYELIGEIASGGMATVYLARLTGVGGFQRFVALKRLHPHLALDADFVQMFLDEARLAAGIHHPNVVPILEVGASAIGYYLVMEYIDGDTLARLLARSTGQGQRLPLPVSLRIGLDMLAGLHAAHELRDGSGTPLELVHRDVSPQNVLVGLDGIARITDFGVARASTRLSATRVGQLKGKVAYMAPEQAQGGDDIDRRADVFSSGVVLWECLAARRLFKAENEMATLSRVLSEPVPPLSRVAPHVPAPIADVVMRALERDPAKRHPTCAAFADELDAAVRRCDRLATPREVGSYLESVLGEETAVQREAVRLWLLRNEPEATQAPRSVPPPALSGTVSHAAVSVADPSESRSYTRVGARRSLGGRALLGLLAVGVAVTAFYAARAIRGSSGAAAPMGSEAVVAASAAVSPVAPPPAAPPPPATATAVENNSVESRETVPEATAPATSAAEPPRAEAAPSRKRSGPRRRKAADAGDEAIPENPYR